MDGEDKKVVMVGESRRNAAVIDSSRCTMRIDMCRTTVAVIAVLACLMFAAAAPAPTLSIAAASDLQAVLATLAQRFEQQAGIATRLTFGPSGQFSSPNSNWPPSYAI